MAINKSLNFLLLQLLVLVLSSQANAVGFNVDISSISHVTESVANDETYSSNTGTTYINYSIQGSPRKLTDDDGLATLFLIHRNAVQKVFLNEWTTDYPLEKPYTAIFKSLEMLENTYRNAAEATGDKQHTIAADRVRAIADKLRAKDPIKLIDLQSSGLESLINDSLSTHSYHVERLGKPSVRGRLDELLLVDIPPSFSANMAPRCRDNPTLNWRSAVRDFTASAVSPDRSIEKTDPAVD